MIQDPFAEMKMKQREMWASFAPRPDLVMVEMHRVLKPNGRIAFATWPPEHFVGRLFAFVGRNSPPPPPGAAPPPQWGNPSTVM